MAEKKLKWGGGGGGGGVSDERSRMTILDVSKSLFTFFKIFISPKLLRIR